jgi:hypothetical protein
MGNNKIRRSHSNREQKRHDQGIAGMKKIPGYGRVTRDPKTGKEMSPMQFLRTRRKEYYAKAVPKSLGVLYSRRSKTHPSVVKHQSRSKGLGTKDAKVTRGGGKARIF